MLERLYEDATNFEFPEDRFDRVYAEVEHALYENTQRAAVIVPLPGLRIESDKVDLGDGMALVAGETFDAPPEARLGRHRRAACCACSSATSAGGEPPPVDEAPSALRVAARLAAAVQGAAAWRSSPLGWSRQDEGAWRALPLARTGGVARGAPWTLAQPRTRPSCASSSTCSPRRA